MMVNTKDSTPRSDKFNEENVLIILNFLLKSMNKVSTLLHDGESNLQGKLRWHPSHQLTNPRVPSQTCPGAMNQTQQLEDIK